MWVFAESVDLKTLSTIIGSIGIAAAFVVKVFLDHRRARDATPCPMVTNPCPVETRHVEMIGRIEELSCRFASALELKNPDTGMPFMYMTPGIPYSIKELKALVEKLREECHGFRVEIRDWKREVEASGVYERRR